MAYFGLKLDWESAGFKDMCKMYPGREPKEIQEKIIKGVERFAKEKGYNLNEEIYGFSLLDLAEFQSTDAGPFMLWVWGSWSLNKEKIFGDVYLIGEGECMNCGYGDFEQWDEGEEKCLHCRNIQPERKGVGI